LRRNNIVLNVKFHFAGELRGFANCVCVFRFVCRVLRIRGILSENVCKQSRKTVIHPVLSIWALFGEKPGNVQFTDNQNSTVWFVTLLAQRVIVIHQPYRKTQWFIWNWRKLNICLGGSLKYFIQCGKLL